MISRRPLGATLGSFADVAELLPADAHSGLQVRSLQLELALDLRVSREADGIQVIADLPQFLTRTVFDPEPVRLGIFFHAVPLDRNAA